MCIGRGFREFTSFYSMAAGTGLCILFLASVSYGRLVQVRAWCFIVELVASRNQFTNSAFVDPPFFLLPCEDIQELQTPNCGETCSTLCKCTTFSIVSNREVLLHLERYNDPFWILVGYSLSHCTRGRQKWNDTYRDSDFIMYIHNFACFYHLTKLYHCDKSSNKDAIYNRQRLA